MIYFAAAGDIHGDHALLVACLDAAIERLGQPLAFVVQVGDFEPIRDEADLATVAGPPHRRKLGSFHRVLSGDLRYPAEVLFIGGNHEPYGWLEQYPTGGELVPGIVYLGRAEVVERHGLRIAGLSGIHSPTRYRDPLPPDWAESAATLKEPTYFRQPDVDRLRRVGLVDILLTHDWPSEHFGPFGNPQSRALMETLRPRLHLTGHMHRPARKSLTHPDGRTTLLLGLHHLGFGHDLFLFSWDGRKMEIVK